ncbi:MAG: BlaI/MecI/CopY family transcriptional regulator [Planctomycetales bacterium]
MPRPPTPHPTDGELEILHVLWDLGSAPLSEICSTLRRQRPVATTTVATMLKLMEEKQLVKKSQGEKTYLWAARISRQSATRGFVRKLLDRAFDGSAQRLVAHLLQEGQLSAKERAELRKLLDDKSQEKKS